MSEKNAFWYLFADREDVFFEKNLVAQNFEKRVYNILKKSEYKYVYFLDMVNGKEMNIFCETVEAALEYQKKAPIVKFTKISYNPVETKGGTRYRFTQKMEAVVTTINELIRKEKYDKYAFVITKDAFSRMYNNVTLCVQLSQVLFDERYINGSIFVLTSDLDDTGKLPKLPEYAMTSDMAERINSGKGRLADRIREAFESDVVEWKRFESRQLRRMLERVFLSHLCAEQRKLEEYHNYMMNTCTGKERAVLCQRIVKNNEGLYKELCKKEFFDRVGKNMNSTDEAGNSQRGGFHAFR